MAAREHSNDFGRSGNAVSRDGSTVVKRPAAGTCLRELAAIARLGDLPVPRVRAGTRPDELRLAFVEGVRATDAIEAGLASSVLRAMGQALRAIQSVPTSRFGAAADERVLVHGDFAPYNVIVSNDGGTVRAVLDWEASCLGGALTDLAWCEFQFRRVSPRHQYAIGHLFEGYGATASAIELEREVSRYQAALSRGGCDPVVPPTGTFHVAAFREVAEGAAFIAAVSRAAGAPFRARPFDPPAEIWAVPGAGGLQAWMNEPAALVAASAFSATSIERATTLPVGARLAFLATHIPPCGVDDVLAIL